MIKRSRASISVGLLRLRRGITSRVLVERGSRRGDRDVRAAVQTTDLSRDRACLVDINPSQ